MKLHVEPTVFVEYRLALAQAELDPARVGWSRAVAALIEWETFTQAYAPPSHHETPDHGLEA